MDFYQLVALQCCKTELSPACGPAVLQNRDSHQCVVLQCCKTETLTSMWPCSAARQRLSPACGPAVLQDRDSHQHVALQCCKTETPNSVWHCSVARQRLSPDITPESRRMDISVNQVSHTQLRNYVIEMLHGPKDQLAE